MIITSKDILFVVLQLALFFLFSFDIHAWRIYFPVFMFWIGVGSLVVGAFIVIVSILQLNVNLSPFPSPLPKSKLIVSGIYKYIRHPIYTGIFMGFIGFSIIADSGYKLLISAILLLLFYFKSIYEEKRLMLVFPDYDLYRQKTGRFFPRFFN